MDFDKLFLGETENEKIYSAEISFSNLSMSLCSEPKSEKTPWQIRRGGILLSIIKTLLSQKGSLIGVKGRKKILIVKDSQERTILIKKILEVLNKP